MKRIRSLLSIFGLAAAVSFSGCAGLNTILPAGLLPADESQEEIFDGIVPGPETVSLNEELSAVRYDGDTGFEDFLAQGGAASEEQVISYLADRLIPGWIPSGLIDGMFGCSTVSVYSPVQHALFGRNYDWQDCTALILETHPDNGYASLSTVNTSFFFDHVDPAFHSILNTPSVLSSLAAFAPMDGMNETGLCAAINMVNTTGNGDYPEGSEINQATGKPDLTETTALRLILDQAGSVDEAVSLLQNYDLHTPAGIMVHFVLADPTGKSVCVEYVNNEMTVIPADLVTNSWLYSEEAKSRGTEDSEYRYAVLSEHLSANPVMDEELLKQALAAAGKSQSQDDQTTQWSIVMDPVLKEMTWYHRENFDIPYRFRLS